MSNFSSLPAEIRERILRNNPQLLHSSFTLSSEYPQILSNAALRKLCSQPISNSEFLNYLQNDFPRLFMIYRPSNSKFYPVNSDNIFADNTALTIIYTLSENTTWNFDMISTMVSYQNPDNIIFDQYGLMPIMRENFENVESIMGRLHTTNIFDLLTTYRILRKRIGCTHIDPNFAKTYVRNHFKTLVENHQQLHNPIYLFDLYCYLAAHTWIFNLNIPINQDDIIIDITPDRVPIAESVEQPKVEALFAQIPGLIDAIWQRLNIIELLA